MILCFLINGYSVGATKFHFAIFNEFWAQKSFPKNDPIRGNSMRGIDVRIPESRERLPDPDSG